MPLELDPKTRALLDQYGFDDALFQSLRDRLQQGGQGPDDNRIKERVEPPTAVDVPRLPALGTPERARLAEIGTAAMQRGEVGAVVLAGGMATRFGGVVKAVVEALPGRTFLSLKLGGMRLAANHAKGRVPVFVMTSFATDVEIRRLLAAESSPALPVSAFAQLISLRLTPEGELFRDQGALSPYAPGHGDLTFALRKSGVLSSFIAEGGRHLFMSNVDNLAATLDPAVIGAHIARGAALTAEVVSKDPGDAGGAPARVGGTLQIVESFRFPKDFSEDTIPVFNVNSFVLDAKAIDRDFALTWFLVRKKVGGQTAIQFEHLVGELSAFLPSACLHVDREGDDGRFQPVKDPDELARRAPQIEAMLRKRGVL
jgi:UTP--glucose-1-phosphate uridylyltransferase